MSEAMTGVGSVEFRLEAGQKECLGIDGPQDRIH
jgi:hypothetical protein